MRCEERICAARFDDAGSYERIQCLGTASHSDAVHTDALQLRDHVDEDDKDEQQRAPAEQHAEFHVTGD